MSAKRIATPTSSRARAPKKSSKPVGNRMSNAEIEELANFGPAIDGATVEKMEVSAQSYGVGRRVAFVVLSKSADDLTGISRTEPETYDHMRKIVDDFAEHVKGLTEAVEAAKVRLHIADCRD